MYCASSAPLRSSFSRAFIFFFTNTATTEIYTLSLHDALPILPFSPVMPIFSPRKRLKVPSENSRRVPRRSETRSEEHTSELQSQFHLVCRLLLEKKKKKQLI